MPAKVHEVSDLKTGTIISIHCVRHGHIVGVSSQGTICAWKPNPKFNLTFLVNAVEDDVYTFRDPNKEEYISVDSGENDAKLRASDKPHRWRVHPSTEEDSYWLESLEFPNTCIYSWNQDGNILHLWQANSFDDYALSWKGFRFRIAPEDISQSEQEYLRRKEELTKMEEAAKAAQAATEKANQELKVRQEDLDDRNNELNKREVEIEELQKQLQKQAELDKNQNNGSTQSLQSQLDQYKQELTKYKESMQKQADDIARREKELKLREDESAKSHESKAGPAENASDHSDLLGQIEMLKGKNQALLEQVANLHKQKDENPLPDDFVHSRTPFDLTSTGRPGHHTFLHLKRL